jgi:hypothetical protein
LGGGQILFPQLKFLLFTLAFFSGIYPEIPKLAAQTDTMICDNGGFEDDFDYYFGKAGLWLKSNNDCIPLDQNSQAITWNTLTLPEFRRFEITTSGLDTLVGINRTKFGSKALLLNNRYGHISTICDGHADVDKLIKRFKVTEENRDFTVWFAVVLEYPQNYSQHSNGRAPYFGISCNRAPESDFCLDPGLFPCKEIYYDSICHDQFDSIVVIDWTCYRIKIPKNMVDSIAILEISVADCAEGLHFAYAYIDGICEECDQGAFGSATLYNHPLDTNNLGISYNGCLDTITFCGSYTEPTICGNWLLDSINANGTVVNNLRIDTSIKQFCFDMPLEYFTDECKDFYVSVYFHQGSRHLPRVLSNTIEICPGDYERYEVEVNTGQCQDNNTSDLLSDDYYYVQVALSHLHGDTFTIERQLDDPYPNESGLYVVKADTGDGTFNLGPFYIQEGSWRLIVKFADCADTFDITPPYFCSGCNKFYRTTISNVTCNDHSSSSISDDTWTFDIKVPGTSGTYDVLPVATGLSYNVTNTINVSGNIGKACRTFTLVGGANCSSTIIVCPPKPCSSESQCQLEVSLKNVSCDENSDFYIEVDTSRIGTGNFCVVSFAYASPGDTTNTNYSRGSFSNPLGPFDEPVYIIFSKCDIYSCYCDANCFKVIYFPKPDCDNLDYRFKKADVSTLKSEEELFVIPNPLNTKEMIFISNMKHTSFEFYNSSSKLVCKGSFTGPEYKYSAEVPPGLYIIKYKNLEGKSKYYKLIKI